MVWCCQIPSLFFRRTNQTRKSRERDIHRVSISAQSNTHLRNWAELPTELLRAIAELLPIPYNFQFHAVCTSWATASKDIFKVAPQFPWLLLKRDRDALCFYSHAQNKYFYLPVASKIHHHYCLGSLDGWLVMSDSSIPKETYVLNPISGAKIKLPYMCTVSATQSHNKKISLLVNPIVVISYVGTISERMAFAKIGDQSWVRIVTHSSGFTFGDIDATIFSCGDIKVVELEGPSLEAFSIETHSRNSLFVGFSLMSAPSGDFLMVQKFERPINFRVMKYDPRVESYWIEIKDLGEASLFLDSEKSMLLSTRDVPGLERNCIYYVGGYTMRCENHKVGAFNIAEGIITEDYFPFEVCEKWLESFPLTWYMPCL